MISQPHRSHGPSKETARGTLFQGAAWRYLVALSVAADFLMFPTARAFDDDREAILTVFPLVGCILAQGSLLAAWLVWGDAPFSRRLLWHWMIAGCLCGVWLIGLALARPPGEFGEASGLTVALTVPVVSLGAQFPFWVARLLFGWRLVRVTAPSAAPASAEQPLTIRDLLLATFLVAASFGVARLSPAAQQEEEFRVAWGVFMVAAATFSFVAILPAAAILLRPRPFARAVQYSLYLAAAPITLLWSAVAIIRFFGLGNLPPWFAFVGLTLLILAYAGTAILAAAVARDHNYQLTWGRSRAGITTGLAPVES
jgi:hypothetical protein